MRTTEAAATAHVRPAAARGRGHRPRDSASLAVQRLSQHAEVRALEPEWRALYERCRSRNPYACPEWVIAWLEHLVRESELALVTVRRDGQLIGVAPCYLRTLAPIGRIPAPRARTVQLAGTVRFPGLTELPQVLAAPGETRSVLRAVLGELMRSADGWDWLELPMEAGQGWFEPQWLGEGAQFRGLVQHKTTRAAVVLPLPGGVKFSGDVVVAGGALRSLMACRFPVVLWVPVMQCLPVAQSARCSSATCGRASNARAIGWRRPAARGRSR